MRHCYANLHLKIYKKQTKPSKSTKDVIISGAKKWQKLKGKSGVIKDIVLLRQKWYKRNNRMKWVLK